MNNACAVFTSDTNEWQFQDLFLSRNLLTVLGDLNNECAVSSAVSLMNSHFGTIFQVELYQIEDLCLLHDAVSPGGPEI